MLELYTEKTGVKVRIPLKPEVLDALKKIPSNGEYYFWSGVSKQTTVVCVWSGAFHRLFRRAGIPDGHSHRFRHTFAARLLEKGVSMENLSKLLGHRTIRVTEKHYASFGKGRQKHLEDVVRKAW